jgi:ABC-type phosphate transport system substrate-binding protein
LKSHKLFHNCLLPSLFLAVSMYAANAYADVVVIVSASSPVVRLTSEQIAEIFLGKADTFPNGGNAVPIDQAEGSSIRNEFYSRIANKRPSQISAYWARIIFTGEGYPPKQMEGDAVVRKAVANNPHAIGYIDQSVVDSSVRVILEP